MLSSHALNAIKQHSEPTKPDPQVIHIEIGNGFAYGSVTIGSPSNKQAIKDLSIQLEWRYQEGGTQNKNMMYRTGQEFKDGFNAIAVGNVIKSELESKGFTVQLETKAYR
jgi:hypothetical protein